eukprot:11188492-Lingulodinium_polyedra.AAC.1
MYGVVLALGGSSPGTDGFPYEVYQQAPLLQACLVAQSVLYAHLGPHVVNYIAGDDPELLVYIPKAGAGVQ